MTTSLTRPLKIAIDLDGTAWKHTYFFSEFCQAMVKRGHQVGILTAHSPDFADMIMMRMYFELLKESPPEGVYNEPDEEVLRELGIENKFGGTEGYGIESFGLKAN